MVMASRVKPETVALFSEFQAEIGVELLRHLETGHDEVEVVDGVDAEFPGSAGALRHRLDLGH